MISFPSLTRVWVWPSRAWGAAGSGICFTQTTTFMAAIVPENPPLDQSGGVARRWRQPGVGGLSPAPGGPESPAHRR